MARALECGQLLRVVDPGGVILVAEVDPVAQARAQAVIEALEWCAGHGAACLYALPAEPPGLPPYDRILYGAVAIGRAPAPVAERFIAPRSRAHPASEAERRVEAALARDPELAGLFAGNEVVAVAGDGRQPRVDLVCRRHRLVVEIDGPEHQASPKFGQDRHRDYELLVAGYLVLRLTNDEVADDLQRAVEKIRAMVRLRRLPSTPPRPRRHDPMSETPTPAQALILWRLLGRQGTALNSEIKPDKAPRDALQKAGLLAVEKEERSLRLTVTDKGWNWAGGHLRDPLPPAMRVLQDWLTRLHHHLDATGATLAEFVGPAPERVPPEPKPTRARKKAAPKPETARKAETAPKAKTAPTTQAAPPDPDRLRARIEEAYLACTGGRKAAAVRLSALRAALADLDRAAVDAGLAAILAGDTTIRLTRISDPKALDAAERDAAFNPAGEPFHEIWIHA